MGEFDKAIDEAWAAMPEYAASAIDRSHLLVAIKAFCKAMRLDVEIPGKDQNSIDKLAIIEAVREPMKVSDLVKKMARQGMRKSEVVQLLGELSEEGRIVYRPTKVGGTVEPKHWIGCEP